LVQSPGLGSQAPGVFEPFWNRQTLMAKAAEKREQPQNPAHALL
jgi:hypothetical protein